MNLQPFSAVLYLIRNKWKTLWVVIIVALTVVLSASISAIVGSFNEDLKTVTSIYQKFHTVTYNIGEVDSINLEDLSKLLIENENISKVFLVKPLNFKNKGIFGVVPVRISFMKYENYTDYMDTVGWKLIEGSLPRKGESEIALTQNVAKNRNLKVGDRVGKALDRSELLSGDYVVSGILEENGIKGGIGSYEYLESISSLGNLFTASSYSTTLCVYSDNNNKAEVENYLNELKNEHKRLIIDTQSSIQEDYKRDYQAVNNLGIVFVLLVTVVISLTMGLLNLIFIINRAYEFGLMGALFYSKLDVIKKILFERFLEVILGWIIGFISLFSVFWLINEFIYYPLGNVGISPFNYNIFISSLAVSFSMFVFSMFGLYFYLVRLDPIDIIERNS